MGRVKRGTKSVSTFRVKRIADPPVLAAGQLWKHRLSTKRSPYAKLDKIDLGESPPVVYYTCFGKQRNRGRVKLWLYAMPITEFLRVFEYQPARKTVPRKKKSANTEPDTETDNETVAEPDTETDTEETEP